MEHVGDHPAKRVCRRRGGAPRRQTLKPRGKLIDERIAIVPPTRSYTFRYLAARDGYAAAVGTGNAIPPAAGYKFGAASASNTLQPQNGFYNPAYGGAGSSSTPPSYAATATANPAYHYNTPAAASPSTAAPGSQIRVADVRGGATIAPSAQVAMTGTAPPAAVGE